MLQAPINQCSGHGTLSVTSHNFKLRTIYGRRSSRNYIQKYSLFRYQQLGILQQQQSHVTCDHENTAVAQVGLITRVVDIRIAMVVYTNTAEPTIYYNNQIPCLSERPGQLVTGMCLVTLATDSSLGPCPSSYIGSPLYYGMRCASFLSLACVT